MDILTLIKTIGVFCLILLVLFVTVLFPVVMGITWIIIGLCFLLMEIYECFSY